ncbi:MAG: methyltransferase domain-containing protein [Deltaproteobacteria bacterium]|nr:methyltransferase domain-containing protein [Deltaproteobacteria bacterium]
MATADPAARAAAPPPEDEATPEYREWLAAAYDTDVYEQWLRPFEELLHRRLELLPKGMALEIGCATGRGTEHLMAALGERVRLVAQEDRGFLLDLARARLADLVGSRLFFNSDPLPRLRYDEKVFATVVANLTWWERADRASLLAEMARVLDDEGQVVLTAPLAGTFSELIDLAREVSVKLDQVSKLEPRIAALEAMFATPEDWAAEVEQAGLVDARVDCTEIELPYASSRELFSSTLAQARWLSLWRRAFAEDDKRLVWHVRQMIDSYWAEGKFTLTLAAGCLTARRPRGFVARKAVERPAPADEPLVPVVLDGDSEAARAPRAPRPATIPPARADSYYASGDAIAAELLGLGPGSDLHARPASVAPRVAPTPPPEPLDAEPIEAEPIEAEAEEAEASGEFSTPGALDPLDEGEPYVPDLADVHVTPEDPGRPRPSQEDLDALLSEGSGLEPAPAFGGADPGPTVPPGRPSQFPDVSPLPLGQPRAVPVHPVELGRPQFQPVEPVDLDEVTAEPDDDLPDWGPDKR